jgi:hypothetical protein
MAIAVAVHASATAAGSAAHVTPPISAAALTAMLPPAATALTALPAAVSAIWVIAGPIAAIMMPAWRPVRPAAAAAPAPLRAHQLYALATPIIAVRAVKSSIHA